MILRVLKFVTVILNFVIYDCTGIAELKSQ